MTVSIWWKPGFFSLRFAGRARPARWSPLAQAVLADLLHRDVDVFLARQVSGHPKEAVALLAQVEGAFDRHRLGRHRIVAGIVAVTAPISATTASAATIVRIDVVLVAAVPVVLVTVVLVPVVLVFPVLVAATALGLIVAVVGLVAVVLAVVAALLAVVVSAATSTARRLRVATVGHHLDLPIGEGFAVGPGRMSVIGAR